MKEKKDLFEISCGIDIATSAQSGGYNVYHGINELSADRATVEKIDVIIDFSHHTMVSGILSFASENGIPAVIATTGHTDEEKELIEKTAESVAVFYSRNMSLGVNLLIDLVRRVSATLEGWDIEIIEKHHRHKLDAPSGTALMLAEAAEKGRGVGMDYTYDRASQRRERLDGEIGISSVRGGSIVGEHEVMFAGKDEVVTVSHNATSRDVFASGALKAAEFICGREKGFYNMSDVISSVI